MGGRRVMTLVCRSEVGVMDQTRGKLILLAMELPLRRREAVTMRMMSAGGREIVAG